MDEQDAFDISAHGGELEFIAYHEACKTVAAILRGMEQWIEDNPHESIPFLSRHSREALQEAVAIVDEAAGTLERGRKYLERGR